MQIELNDQEQNALVQLLDVATKATGLQGAEAALVILNKIREGKKQETEAPKEETE